MGGRGGERLRATKGERRGIGGRWRWGGREREGDGRRGGGGDSERQRGRMQGE